MSIPYLPPQDDSLDIHVEDLDSFELSDEQNMSDGDAETQIFVSNHSSSNCEPDSSCEPDTTTSPPSKIKPPDPSRQPVEKHIDYECFCCHPKVVKFNSLFKLKSQLPDVYLQIQAPLAGPRRLTQHSIPLWAGKMYLVDDGNCLKMCIQNMLMTPIGKPRYGSQMSCMLSCFFSQMNNTVKGLSQGVKCYCEMPLLY